MDKVRYGKVISHSDNFTSLEQKSLGFKHGYINIADDLFLAEKTWLFYHQVIKQSETQAAFVGCRNKRTNEFYGELLRVYKPGTDVIELYRDYELLASYCNL